MGVTLGEQFRAFEEQMTFRVARQAVLAANVANVDTPGFRRGDLEFSATLESAVARLARTDEKHLPSADGTHDGQYRLVRGPRGTRPDGNGVDMDTELVQVNRNAGAFSDQASILARLVTLYRISIGSGR